jgi:hypothetical protein
MNSGGTVLGFDNRNFRGEIVCETSFVVSRAGIITSARTSCPF